MKKFLVVLVYIILAIPVPVSLISIIGSLVSFASIGMAESFAEVIVPLLAMFLAGTYSISYFISLLYTITKKKVHFLSFLPMIHLVVTALSFALWSYFDYHIY